MRAAAGMLSGMTSLVNRLPDGLWQRIQPLLPPPPPRPHGGVPRRVPDLNCVAALISWPTPPPLGPLDRVSVDSFSLRAVKGGTPGRRARRPADLGGYPSATSAPPNASTPWPCWPARSSASTRSDNHHGHEPSTDPTARSMMQGCEDHTCVGASIGRLARDAGTA
jgi:hypothetical protein